MKKTYDLKKMKVKHRGPLVDAKTSKVTKTVKIDMDIVSWLLQESERRRVPYQTIINSILKEAMDRGNKSELDELRQMIEDVKRKVG